MKSWLDLGKLGMKQKMSNDLVLQKVRQLAEDNSVGPDSKLIGSSGVLDSLGLVELCIQLEDEAREGGFVFDWVSDSAMSNSRGIFQTVASLQEYYSQCKRATP